MSSTASAVTDSRPVRGLVLLAGLLWVVWLLSDWILNNDSRSLIMAAMAVGLISVAMIILKDWRSGFFFFIIWLLLEDLARKYLGNNMVLYFGKDVLAGITYLSLDLAKRRRQADSFKPSFLLPLGIFIGLAFVQVFNPNTPTILYGLLGMKLYFFYVPLMFVGYALLRNADDLRKFFIYNIAAGFVIAILGIIQSIVGLSFLNPAQLTPELEQLGNFTRYSPITHQRVPVPDSVFVSGGRFATYLIVLVIMAMGIQAHWSSTRKTTRRRDWWGFLAVGAALVAAMQSGSRGCIIYVTASILIIAIGFYWGAPLNPVERRHLLKSGGRVILFAAVGLTIMFVLFPDEMGAHWAFYSETLTPGTSSYELSGRLWDYPVGNFEKAFSEPDWLEGQGTGTASLGGQYVTELVGVSNVPGSELENGWAALDVEMGILGPILWVIWVLAFLFAAWKIVRQLRGSCYFPVALSIFWYSFLLLGPLTWGGIGSYENFVLNAYFWILAGVLFRLPHLLPAAQTVRASSPTLKTAHAPVMVPVR